MQRSNAQLLLVNPNIMALKMAEALADLKSRGTFALSRKGYYDRMENHAADEFAAVRARFANILARGPA